MDINELRAGWERLGESDPLWAVLTDPARQGGGWTPAEFLASGEAEIATVFERLSTFGIEPVPEGRALDFGCGAGRLTQALARRYEHADGVDISEAMLTAARSLAPPDNVTFHHNAASNLGLFDDDTFDLVYSSIVLQHMPAMIALGYIREFVRVTRRGGYVVFQAPDEYREPPKTMADRARDLRVRLAIGTRLRGQKPAGPDETHRTLAAHATPMDHVLAALEQSGATVADIAVTNSLDPAFNGDLRYFVGSPSYGWVSRQYAAVVD